MVADCFLTREKAEPSRTSSVPSFGTNRLRRLPKYQLYGGGNQHGRSHVDDLVTTSWAELAWMVW
jgi:hypothetical protein